MAQSKICATYTRARILAEDHNGRCSMAQKDNLRQHGEVEPLSQLNQIKGRTLAQGWNLDHGQWEQYQAERMACDLSAIL